MRGQEESGNREWFTEARFGLFIHWGLYALGALETYGRWMRLHGRSIYSCGPSEYESPADFRFTQNGKRLYLHVFNWPFKHLHLDGMAGRIEHAQFLHDSSEIRFLDAGGQTAQGHMTPNLAPGSVTLELPVIKPGVAVPVVELFLN